MSTAGAPSAQPTSKQPTSAQPGSKQPSVDPTRPLAGLSVLEIGGGAAAAYCGRMLVDAGAQVTRAAWQPDEGLRGLMRDALPWDADYAAYAHAGKASSEACAEALQALARTVDLVIVGEDSTAPLDALEARIATLELSWFGRRGGPWQHWQGSDLIIQALSGMPHMVGHEAGPPTFTGDRQATLIAGVTAYIAACAAVLGARQQGSRPADRSGSQARRLEVSILEANMVLAEMHMHFFERDGIPMRRCGLNRFSPNSPVGVYPCREGWVGITITTPDQWRALCQALPLPEQAADEGLVTRELRFARQDEVEAALVRVLATRSAGEWAAIGRAHRVPIVVVPDAAGILDHPVFRERQSLATLPLGERVIQVPRTPLALQASPIADALGQAFSAEALPPPPGAQTAPAASRPAPAVAAPDAGPLQGLQVVDFTMGWAGPLAARLLADLGATVLKVEAARYPDWWRGVNWTPEYIRDKGYENAKTFCGLNRGKRGVSLDLTRSEGQALALELIRGADIVIENQASGVMAKLGLGEPVIRAHNPRAVMVSMSAFGTGNAWSDTRAYGSTLEQGAGVPCLTGRPQDPPTMAHLAYGDPIGGLFGCAAALTALVHRETQTPSPHPPAGGQYANVSMVEAMLQFTTPSLLAFQRDSQTELRWANRHPVLAPHGIFASQGEDQWLALSVQHDAAFQALARVLHQDDWLTDPTLGTAAGRRLQADRLEAVIARWAAERSAMAAALALQAAGVAAAPLLKAEDLPALEHFAQTGFYIDLTREVSGPQRQLGLAIVQDGLRLGARQPAPLLGEHSQAVLAQHAGVDATAFAQLLDQGVVSFAPTPSRNLVSPTASASS
jgi:crotonobetainyl-CoA:carnitine CoA-transferase CaiB-like acyl-CoA transferase